jgi:hypothetical protein
VSRSKAKKAVKDLPKSFVPIKDNNLPSDLQQAPVAISGYDGAWILVSGKHIANAQRLAAHGWRKHVAYRKALMEARTALQCSLFWNDSAHTAALIDKLEDRLTA